MPLLFNTGYYQSRDYYSENMTPQRRVVHFELELLESGTGFSFVNGVSYPHIPHRLLLAKPGDLRFTVGAFDCWFARFDCPDAGEAALLSLLPATVLAGESPLKSMLTELDRLRNLPSAPYFACQAALCALLAETVARLRPEKAERGDRDPHFPAILASKEYVDAHYGEKIGLERLSAQAHLSKNFFRVKFCQLMGLSPREYISQVRLAHARRLLRTTAQPLSDIALACGFDSQSYLNYVFKQKTGMTPLSYRHNAQEPEGK